MMLILLHPIQLLRNPSAPLGEELTGVASPAPQLGDIVELPTEELPMVASPHQMVTQSDRFFNALPALEDLQKRGRKSMVAPMLCRAPIWRDRSGRNVTSSEDQNSYTAWLFFFWYCSIFSLWWRNSFRCTTRYLKRIVFQYAYIGNDLLFYFNLVLDFWQQCWNFYWFSDRLRASEIRRGWRGRRPLLDRISRTRIRKQPCHLCL